MCNRNFWKCKFFRDIDDQPLLRWSTTNPRGGTRDFKWRGWSNGAKSQDQKKSLVQKLTPKNPMPILWPLKVPERGNAITQRKTLEIEHSCLFIHHTIWIYPFPHLILFNTPKKSLLKSSYPSQIFVPKKIPESKISNPKKSFDHPRHLKSRVPSLGEECNLASMKTHCKDVTYSSHINSG